MLDRGWVCNFCINLPVLTMFQTLKNICTFLGICVFIKPSLKKSAWRYWVRLVQVQTCTSSNHGKNPIMLYYTNLRIKHPLGWNFENKAVSFSRIVCVLNASWTMLKCLVCSWQFVRCKRNADDDDNHDDLFSVPARISSIKLSTRNSMI